MGGQLPASLIYTVETRPRERWGLYGSYVMMAANVGTLLGNFVGATLRSVLSEEALMNWGWRIPFLSGILIAFVAVYLKFHGEEHHPNEGHYDTDGEPQDGAEDVEVRPKHPLREAVRKENLPALVSATLTPMLWGAGFYVSFVWMAIFMDDLISPPIPNAFWINAMAMLFGVTLPLPLLGLLSDYVGRVRIMAVGAIGLGALGPFMVLIISKGQPVPAFFAQWAIGLLLCAFGGPISAWLVEKFPRQVRLTSASLGYDLAHCTASAFSPLIATALAQNVGIASPGILYPLFATLSLIGLFISTQVHYDGGVEPREGATETQQEVAPEGETEEEEPTVKEII